MPITAYSRTFKRELDATQLARLFNEWSNGDDVSFRDFVKGDIECPACNTTGGHYVNEGVSSTGMVTRGYCINNVIYYFYKKIPYASSTIDGLTKKKTRTVF